VCVARSWPLIKIWFKKWPSGVDPAWARGFESRERVYLSNNSTYVGERWGWLAYSRWIKIRSVTHSIYSTSSIVQKKLVDGVLRSWQGMLTQLIFCIVDWLVGLKLSQGGSPLRGKNEESIRSTVATRKKKKIPSSSSQSAQDKRWWVRCPIDDENEDVVEEVPSKPTRRTRRNSASNNGRVVGEAPCKWTRRNNPTSKQENIAKQWWGRCRRSFQQTNTTQFTVEFLMNELSEKLPANEHVAIQRRIMNELWEKLPAIEHVAIQRRNNKIANQCNVSRLYDFKSNTSLVPILSDGEFLHALACAGMPYKP